jgi:methionyl-tRNA formyltransferase
MKIGIISSSDQLISIAYTLASQGLQVCIFFAPTEDNMAHQKVLAFIQAAKLPFQQEKQANTDVYNWLDDTQPEVVFVYGYRHLLDVQRFAGIPAFNIHPGPLPSFRGPAPLFWQLKTGQPTLGFTIHVLSERFDAGPVVWTKSIPNLPHYHYAIANQLCSQLCMEGISIILKALFQLQPFPKIDTAGIPSRYQKRPQLHDVMINWEKMDGAEICNLIRACNPWNKGALTIFRGQEIKLMDGVMTDVQTDSRPGTVIWQGDTMHIACAGGKAIRTNMLYMYEGYLPAYHAGTCGLRQGVVLG